MQVLSPDQENPKPQLTEYRLSGHSSGSVFTLVREDDDCASRCISGRFLKDAIRLSVPASDGTVAKLELKRGTLEKLRIAAANYSTECATRYNRRVWRARLEEWSSQMESKQSELENAARSAKEKIDSCQKTIDDCAAGSTDVQNKLAIAKQDVAAKVKMLTAAGQDVIRLEKEMKENWSAQVQQEWQNAKKRQEEAASDLKISREKLDGLVQELGGTAQSKQSAQLELSQTQSSLQVYEVELKSMLGWRRTLREAGFQKALRRWKPGTCSRARIIGTVTVRMSPDDMATSVGTLIAPIIVDVLPLDSDWYIIRYQGSYSCWVKAKSLKML